MEVKLEVVEQVLFPYFMCLFAMKKIGGYFLSDEVILCETLTSQSYFTWFLVGRALGGKKCYYFILLVFSFSFFFQ